MRTPCGAQYANADNSRVLSASFHLAAQGQVGGLPSPAGLAVVGSPAYLERWCRDLSQRKRNSRKSWECALQDDSLLSHGLELEAGRERWGLRGPYFQGCLSVLALISVSNGFEEGLQEWKASQCQRGTAASVPSPVPCQQAPGPPFLPPVSGSFLVFH